MDEIEDTNILDYKDEMNTDIKIKPSFYIHLGIIMAQKTLMYSVAKTNISEGITGYMVLIEHIETLCKAAGYISDQYEIEIKAYRESEEIQSITRNDVKMAKMANKKLGLLMKEVFSRAPTTEPLKI